MVGPRLRWLVALSFTLTFGTLGWAHADDTKARVEASVFTGTEATIAARQPGDRAIQSGSFDDAARSYAEAVLRYPNDPVLRMLTGVALSAVRKPDLAVQQFRQACRITGDDLIASLLLQGALAQTGQNDAAQTVYLDAVRRYGRNSAGLDSTASLTWLANALKETPSSPILHLLLGDAYQIAENGKMADYEYHRAIILAPEWAKPKVNLGLLRLSQNKPDQAVALFESALKRDPNNVELMFFRADAQRQSGDLKGAIASYHTIESRVPASKAPTVAAQALTGLGQAYAASGQYDDAVNVLNRAKTIAPKDPAPSAALGEVQVKQRSFGDAAQNYADALRLTKTSGLFGTQSVLYQALAQTQLADKQYRSALDTLSRATSDEPESAFLWQQMRGEVMLAMGDQSGAETAFRSSLDTQCDQGIFPQDTLSVIAAKGMINAVTASYRADVGGMQSGFAGGSGAAITGRGPTPGGTTADREEHALSALSAIAQFRGDRTQEIALREALTQRRQRAIDFYALADAYDSRAGDKIKARAYYQKALNIGGLTETQSDRARLRIKQLNTLAKP